MIYKILASINFWFHAIFCFCGWIAHYKILPNIRRFWCIFLFWSMKCCFWCLEFCLITCDEITLTSSLWIYPMRSSGPSKFDVLGKLGVLIYFGYSYSPCKFSVVLCSPKVHEKNQIPFVWWVMTVGGINFYNHCYLLYGFV